MIRVVVDEDHRVIKTMFGTTATIFTMGEDDSENEHTSEIFIHGEVSAEEMLEDVAASLGTITKELIPNASDRGLLVDYMVDLLREGAALEKGDKDE